QLGFVNGEGVTAKIREKDVPRAGCHVANLPSISEDRVRRQRELAENVNVSMDGRDIGTHVIPDADVKVWLIAPVVEHAKRRYAENVKKGTPSDLETLKKEIAERDKRDMEREHAPLERASDAVAIDTTNLTIDDVVEKILTLINQVRDQQL